MEVEKRSKEGTDEIKKKEENEEKLNEIHETLLAGRKEKKKNR